MLHNEEFDVDSNLELSGKEDSSISENDNEPQAAIDMLVNDVYLTLFPLLDAASAAHLALADKRHYKLAERYLGKPQFDSMLSIVLSAEKTALLAIMQVELNKMIDAKVASLKIEKNKPNNIKRSTKIGVPLGVGILIGMAALVYFVFPENIAKARIGADFDSRADKINENLLSCPGSVCYYNPYGLIDCYRVFQTVCGDLRNADACGEQVADAARALSAECSKAHLLVEAAFKLAGASGGLIIIAAIYACIFCCLKDGDSKITRDTVGVLNFDKLDLSIADPLFKNMLNRFNIQGDLKVYSVEKMLNKIYAHLDSNYQRQVVCLPSNPTLLSCSFFKTHELPASEVVISIPNEKTPLLNM